MVNLRTLGGNFSSATPSAQTAASCGAAYDGFSFPPAVITPLCQRSSSGSSWIRNWISMSTFGSRYARSAASPM